MQRILNKMNCPCIKSIKIIMIKGKKRGLRKRFNSKDYKLKRVRIQKREMTLNIFLKRLIQILGKLKHSFLLMRIKLCKKKENLK